MAPACRAGNILMFGLVALPPSQMSPSSFLKKQAGIATL